MRQWLELANKEQKMSRNGSGTYILPVGNPVVTGTTISSNWANTTLSDISTALTGSIASDGQTPVTGNIQMGSNKITGMANGTALTDAATVAQAVPTGAILMWSGSIATIPTGWLICDGTNGTPDLRSRFVVGAGSTYAVNATGGSANATLVSHSHTASSSSSVTDNGHQHVVNTWVGNGAQGADGAAVTGNNTQTAFGNFFSAGADTATTNISVSTSTSISTEGSSATNANLPPYLALAYIMKA